MAKAEIGEPAPDAAALLIIDMINDLDFEGSEALVPTAEAAAEAIRILRNEAARLSVPVVYVNDNFGQWHSERSRLVEHCGRKSAPGAKVVKKLAPRRDDFFVIKPRFSGFYSTNLPVLLPQLGASRLVLTGVAADVCVLFTAADAHMRDYELWVPRDTTASDSEERTRWALGIMENSMNADTRPTTELSLEEWLKKTGKA